MAISHIEDHYSATVLPSVLEQYKQADKWGGCLRSVVEGYREGVLGGLQEVENSAWELSEVFKLPDDPSSVSEERMDYLASLTNLARMDGETNEELFQRIIRKVRNRDSGTPNNVIYCARQMSKDDSPVYFDEEDMTFFVYTPKGRQLKRSEVKRLSPGGVLGLPAAAIYGVGGAPIKDWKGRSILCVARDENVGKKA